MMDHFFCNTNACIIISLENRLDISISASYLVGGTGVCYILVSSSVVSDEFFLSLVLPFSLVCISDGVLCGSSVFFPGF